MQKNAYKKLSKIATDIQTTSRFNKRVRTTKFVVPTTSADEHTINIIRDEAAFPENRLTVTIEPFSNHDETFADIEGLQANCFLPAQAEQLAMNLLKSVINNPCYDKENLTTIDSRENGNPDVRA